MRDENQLEIAVDSKFLKECQTKWRELILFKNSFCDYLLSDAEKVKRLKDGGYINDATEDSYVRFIRNFAEQRSDVIITGWAGHTASGVDGEDFSIGFNFINQVERELENNKFVPNKKLIIKFDRGQKAYVELNNIEKLFLTSDVTSNISSIDYSKSFLQLEKINILDDLITTTSKSDFDRKVNNKKFGETYKNLRNSLENKLIGKVDDLSKDKSTSETNKQYFSPFIGFSIKSLTVDDVINEKNNTIKKQDAFLKKETRTVSVNSVLENEKGYDSEVFKWIKDNERFGILQEKGSFLNGKINVKDSLSSKVEISQISFNESITKGTDLFTICYFSPFKKEDSKTFFKTEVSSNHEVEIYVNESDRFVARTNPAKSETLKKLLVSTISDEEFKKNLNFTHRVFNSFPFDSNKESDDIKKTNKGLSEVTTDMGYLIKSVDFNDKLNQFEILLEFNKIKDGETYSESFITSDEVKNYHLFIPDVFIETLKGRKPLKIDFKKTSVTEDGTEFVQIKYVMPINKENFSDLFELGSSEVLRILSPFYHYKWFFTSKYNQTYDVTNAPTELYPSASDPTGYVNYQKFYANFKFKRYGTKEIDSEKYNYKFVVNNKVIESVGGEKPSLLDPRRKGDLQGEGEKVLKVSENATVIEESELNRAVSGPNSDFSRLDRLNAASDALKSGAIKDQVLILDFVALNRISESAKFGEDNSKDFKDVDYDFKINPYNQRRGNIQPKLLAILSKALEITQKTYPSLKSVKIMSSSIVPIDISAYVYHLKKIENLGEEQLKEQVEINYPGLGSVLTEKTINQIIQSFKAKGSDMNHALGFGADVYLTRLDAEGNKKRVCLWQPNDNNDFNIAKAFLQSCLDLGATGVGAGIYYMNYPEFINYLTQDKINKYTGNREVDKKIKGEYNEIYGKYNIEPAKKGDSKIGKFIIDNDGLPIRRLGDPYNAFHVQIFGTSYDYYENAFKKIENLFDLEDVNKNSGNSKNLKKLKERISKKPKYKLVWGESYSWKTADKWLKDLVGNTRVYKNFKGFENVTEITQENVKEISKVQFVETHSEKTKSGDVVAEYVELKEVQKKEEA